MYLSDRWFVPGFLLIIVIGFLHPLNSVDLLGGNPFERSIFEIPLFSLHDGDLSLVHKKIFTLSLIFGGVSILTELCLLEGSFERFPLNYFTLGWILQYLCGFFDFYFYAGWLYIATSVFFVTVAVFNYLRNRLR
jgi:hypothetical protein